MLSFAGNTRYFLYHKPTDMRKSFNGLCGIVRNELKQNPVSGEVYLFINRRRTMIKLLVWDRNGFWLFAKRLEQGTFQRPLDSDSPSGIAIDYETLVMLLEGIDYRKSVRRKRFKLTKKIA